jgi:hypothetical protein
MTVSAQSLEKGQVSAEIPVQPGSSPGRVALNVKYLLDYLEGKEGLITLGKEEGSSPALFHYGSRPIVAIMPMNVQWDGEKPETDVPQVETTEGATGATGENPEMEREEEDAGESEAGEENPEQPEPESLSHDGTGVNQEGESPDESVAEPAAVGMAAEAASKENPYKPEKTKTPDKRRNHRKKT